MIGEEQCCGRFCDVPNSPLCTCDKQTQSNAPLILEDLVAGDYLTESMKMLMIEQRNEVKRWHKVYQHIHHLYSSNQKTMPLYELMELIDEVVIE